MTETKRNNQCIRLGMVGLDTSHVPAFARFINQPTTLCGEPIVRVVAAFPGGNPDFPLSRDRVAGFTDDIRQLGIPIVSSLEELIANVDGVLIQSVDGSQHLEQAEHVFAAHKPVFIDKPLAASFRDVLRIAELGESVKVPWFTASAMRYSPGYPELRSEFADSEITGAATLCPLKPAIGHPDLFWYGVHGTDLLYSILGCGCRRVSCLSTPQAEQLTGTWSDGRIGSVMAIRDEPGACGFGATIYGRNGSRSCFATYDYGPIVRQIIDFFQTGQSPIEVNEMTEVFAFMAAAELSRHRQGQPVDLDEIFQNGV